MEKGSETILLVDDEHPVLKVAKAMLQALGYTVLDADSGHSAISMLTENLSSIDLVYLDWVMPDLDGADLVHATRETGYTGPIAIISGHVMEDETLPADVVGVLIKPYNMAKLAKHTRRFLEE